MPAHHRVEEQEIGNGDKTGGESESAVPEPEVKGKEPVETDIHRDGNKTNDHREVAPVDRVKGRREHFHPRITGQSDRVKLEGGRRLARRGRGKAPVLVN